MGQKGGSGGIYGCDGYDHIGMIDASGGVLDQDYEIFEQATPHRVLYHEYWEDSAGAGRWRGGLGVGDPTWWAGETGQAHHLRRRRRGALVRLAGRRRGHAQHHPGASTRASSEWRTLTTKDLVQDVPDGTLYFQQASGGGGWGDPRLRPVEKVLRDARNGVVGVTAARELYGVAIDAATWTVDEAETAKLRTGVVPPELHAGGASAGA